jgi:hypothetical protein
VRLHCHQRSKCITRDFVYVVDPHEMKRMCLTTLDDGGYEFRCPGCGRPWQYFLVRHVLQAVMNKEEVLKVGKRVSRNHINSQQMQTCSTCGIKFTRDFTKQWYEDKTRAICAVCSVTSGVSKEVCWLCGGTWTQYAVGGGCGNATCKHFLDHNLHVLRTCETKTIGEVVCPKTRACPKCCQLIEHKDRCKHVTCLVCKCEFCFVCLKKKVGNDWQCGDSSAVCPVADRQKSLIPN